VVWNDRELVARRASALLERVESFVGGVLKPTT
jgi:hypothetical protein